MLVRKLAALLAAAAMIGLANAEEYPVKPVRLVVPVPPGGPIDLAGRLIARELQERWTQPVIVENKAGGSIGTEFVAKSAADGYTLMIISSTPLVTLPHLQPVPYDVLTAFVPIVQTVSLTYALIAHPNSGIATLAQLIEEARKSPGRLNIATGGVGAGQHLYLELFKQAAGVDLVHVPFKGAGPALQGYATGQVHGLIDVTSGAIPIVRSGKGRALMVTGAKPLPQLPEAVPFDALFPGVGIPTWHGLFAPAGLSRAHRERISLDVQRIVHAPAVAERFRELGMEPTGLVGEAFDAIVRSDSQRWGELIRRTGIRSP